ncbi:MAG: putative quinol monooxygenase [Croceivirga sp.]
MLIRIVKLTFSEENISSFEAIFEETKEMIRNFDGCQFLELYQDNENPNVFFTYSKWTDDSYLQGYRNSDVFTSVWSRTKVLFSERPEAWSVCNRVSLV